MTAPTTNRERLLLEHEHINHALDQLIAAYETGDHDIARVAFATFDRTLAAHLRMEDDRLLPRFAVLDPAEAETLRAEHRSIRAAIDELGVGTDLHLTRLSAIRQLAALLRIHAHREDSFLYRWADSQPWMASPERPLTDHATN
jgi:hypothetical protein